MELARPPLPGKCGVAIVLLGLALVCARSVAQFARLDLQNIQIEPWQDPGAWNELNVSIRWQGKGAQEKGYDAAGKCIVAIDPRYYRPAEVDTLLGDAAKAKKKLGWTPKVSFRELVAEMAREDLQEAEREKLVRRHGYKAFNQHE